MMVVEEIRKYPMLKEFVHDMYNFTPIQADQNKPQPKNIAEDRIEVDAGGVNADKEEGEFGVDAGGLDADMEEGEFEMDADEEEGELEEGQIEMDSEQLIFYETTSSSSNDRDGGSEVIKLDTHIQEEAQEFDRHASLILEEMKMVTTEETKASLETACARLRRSLEKMKQMCRERCLPVLKNLIDPVFNGMQTVYDVVNSSSKKKDEDRLLRLLLHFKNQYSLLLTSEQLKKLNNMVQCLVFFDDKRRYTNGVPSHNLVLSNSNSGNTTMNKAGCRPLLDPYTTYDVESLPSPTYEDAQPLPMPKTLGLGATIIPCRTTSNNVAYNAFSPYNPDAINPISTYQHKYSGTSYLASNQLPGQTPFAITYGDVHSNGEVSRPLVGDNAHAVNFAFSSDLCSGSSGSSITRYSGLQSAPLAVSPLVSNRDPRLSILNQEFDHTCHDNRLPVPDKSRISSGFSYGLMNPRKNKAVDEPILADNNFKRRRICFPDSREVCKTPSIGRWCEQSCTLTSESNNLDVKMENRKSRNGIVFNGVSNANSNFNIMDGRVGQIHLVGGAPEISESDAPTVSLPSLLKAMAVPVISDILMQLIVKEQERLMPKNWLKVEDSCDLKVASNAIVLPKENGVSLKSSKTEQNSVVKPQLPDETMSTNTHSVGGIRLKPRDPRRILHYNTVHNGERSQSEPSKISDIQSNNDLSTIREQAKQTQTPSFDDLQFPQEDITQKFTNSLHNNASTISSFPSTYSLQTVPYDSPEHIPNKINMTAMCGEPTEGGNAVDQSQAPNSWGHVDHLLDGYDDQQRDAIQSERARRIEEQHKLFSAKKLSLVLDLDHTLLNSAKFSDVDATQADILRKKEKRDQEKPQRHLFRFQHLGLWTKLRPGVWNFLDRASKLFELHICTMGNKMYADEMAKVLDPKGTLFAGRVISRGDNSSINGDLMLPTTKDLYGVLGLESAVLIIDDSLRVWPHNKNNLIVVERYNYFPSSKRQFSLPGPSLLDINHDERIENGTLASTLAVIERIHKSFFSHGNLYNVDVRNVLASEQRKILSGCRILFSRIFPAEEPNPHLHPLWQAAEQFGAVCTNQIDEQVTHVVAKALGTDKVNWALSTQRYVVQPGWVEASALLYRRANEHDFMVKK